MQFQMSDPIDATNFSYMKASVNRNVKTKQHLSRKKNLLQLNEDPVNLDIAMSLARTVYTMLREGASYASFPYYV